MHIVPKSPLGGHAGCTGFTLLKFRKLRVIAQPTKHEYLIIRCSAAAAAEGFPMIPGIKWDIGMTQHLITSTTGEYHVRAYLHLVFH